MKRCPMYEQRNAAERKYFGNKIVVCNVEECPLGNLEEIKYGGEVIGLRCKVNGLVDSFWEHPSLNIRIKERKEILKFKTNEKRKLPVELD